MIEKLREIVEKMTMPAPWKLWGTQIHWDKGGDSDINKAAHVATFHQSRTFDADAVCKLRNCAPELLDVVEAADRFTDDDYYECMHGRSRSEVTKLRDAFSRLRAKVEG